ncbi:DNA cytosine methyltransferase (plasmid) [Nostoc sp. C052]|uniref:DNA cytosine methyltransferase n=1 Tax=Nostoc sp. C052 TaxID=2576902 RepID=UPI0015C3C1E2|nr:DNA cytosine methyltransferase [Nostoc sp. C052]QLE46359.1 DNA cytosine methyltransferase [Nostoc sp. C052]
MLGTVVDLYSGVGGLTWGFHQTGFQVKVAIEKDPIHAATYSQNYPSTHVINRSATEVTAEEIVKIAGADIQILVGGPPCQRYSIQSRQMDNDPRGLLIWDFSNKVSLLRPKHFVMENVPGLIAPKFKPVFDALLESFRKIGYGISWRKLNAAEYGTPQDRNRIIVVGTLVGNKLPRIPKPSQEQVTVQDAIADLPEVENFPELLEGDAIDYSLLGSPSDYVRRLNQKVNIQVITGMQRTSHSPEVQERFLATLPNKIEPISRFKKLAWGGRSNTLRAAYDKAHGNHTPPRPIHPDQGRCITVRESARLHGYPDGFRFARTKTKAYQQIGNSVPPLLSLAIAQELAKVS